jgi:hypothetical protein
MIQDEVLQTLNNRMLLEGHFRLTSGLHSDRHSMRPVLQNPAGRGLGALADVRDLGANLTWWSPRPGRDFAVH